MVTEDGCNGSRDSRAIVDRVRGGFSRCGRGHFCSRQAAIMAKVFCSITVAGAAFKFDFDNVLALDELLDVRRAHLRINRVAPEGVILYSFEIRARFAMSQMFDGQQDILLFFVDRIHVSSGLARRGYRGAHSIHQYDGTSARSSESGSALARLLADFKGRS